MVKKKKAGDCTGNGFDTATRQLACQTHTNVKEMDQRWYPKFRPEALHICNNMYTLQKWLVPFTRKN